MIHAPVTHRHREPTELSANHKRIYQLIRRAGTTNRADLVRESSFTFPSVSRMVAELIELSMVREDETRRGGMGKPPIDLTLNPAHAFSLGIYLDGEMVHSAFIDALGSVVQQEVVPSKPLTALFTSIIGDTPAARSQLIGLGVSAADIGIADSELAELEARIGFPLYVDCLIAASVRYERYFGHGQNQERFVVFDAAHLELGAMVGRELLAQLGTLAVLLEVTEPAVLESTNVLFNALKGALRLVGTNTLIVSGMPLEDFEQFHGRFPGVEVKVGTPELSPAVQVATLPFYDQLSV